MSSPPDAEPAEVGADRGSDSTLDTALRRCCWVLGSALAVLVALALALWAGAARWPSRLAAVEIERMSLDRVPADTSALTAHARLRLTNRTLLPFRIHGMSYRIETGGRELARGRWAPLAPLRVPSRGSVEVDVAAGLDSSRLAAAALVALGEGSARARIDAEVEVTWWLGRLRVPLAVERTWSLGLPAPEPRGGR